MLAAISHCTKPLSSSAGDVFRSLCSHHASCCTNACIMITCFYYFNYSMNTISILLKCCKMTSCIPALIARLLPPLFVLASLPPPMSSANSGSNETSIWPVRETQTSLPLWEEEPGTCQGKRLKEESQENGNSRKEKWRQISAAGGMSVHPSLPPLMFPFSGQQY